MASSAAAVVTRCGHVSLCPVAWTWAVIRASATFPFVVELLMRATVSLTLWLDQHLVHLVTEDFWTVADLGWCHD